MIADRTLATLRRICLALPDAYEEKAWVGVRWMVRKKNFAHVVEIAGGRPPAYFKAAQRDGVVLTFRTDDVLRAALQPPRFFHAPWGTLWGTKVVGMPLAGRINWDEVETLVTQSYQLLAPQRR